jgi:hypothetical protein
MDGGTRNLKRMNSMELVGDTNRTSANVSVRYTDDDYQTWSDARTVDLSDRPILHNLGSFRKRAFELTHESDTPLRLNTIEVDVAQMTR